MSDSLAPAASTRYDAWCVASANSPVDRIDATPACESPQPSAAPVELRPIESPAFAPSEDKFRALEAIEIDQLEHQGCSAEDWSRVRVARHCDLARIRQTTFLGDVRIGALCGLVEPQPGLLLPCGVQNVVLRNCTLGDGVLIRNVRQAISDYDIEDGVVLWDVGGVTMRGASSFGNGVRVQVLREDGAMETPIYDGLSTQTAALLTGAGDGSPVRERLVELIERRTEETRSSRGRIGRGAIVRGAGELVDVRIGPAARIEQAARIENCTLASVVEAPVEIGEGATLVDTIVGAGSHVTDGARLTRCFVGQGCRIGAQFSGLDSLFFANVEAYRGEACAALAGPFTVTHHKATLLIAAQTSFFNAGAGTSQCNHAYKTGPVHYGVLERGCKTGGQSGVNWPANVGAFTTLLGRHRGEFDTRDFPFSTVVEHHGRSRLIPAVNLIRIGPWRDVKKWQIRDRRPAGSRQDQLHPQAISPWSVQRMLRGRAILERLCANHSSDMNWIEFAGVQIKPSDARRGCELYDRAVRRFVAEQLVETLEAARRVDPTVAWTDGAPRVCDEEEQDDRWVDLGGAFMTRRRLRRLLDDLLERRIDDLGRLQQEFEEAWRALATDQRQWAWRLWLREQGKRPEQTTEADLRTVVEEWRALSESFLLAALDDGRDDVDSAEMWDADRRIIDRLYDRPARTDRPEPRVLAELQAELESVRRRAAELLGE